MIRQILAICIAMAGVPGMQAIAQTTQESPPTIPRSILFNATTIITRDEVRHTGFILGRTGDTIALLHAGDTTRVALASAKLVSIDEPLVHAGAGGSAFLIGAFVGAAAVGFEYDEGLFPNISTEATVTMAVVGAVAGLVGYMLHVPIRNATVAPEAFDLDGAERDGELERLEAFLDGKEAEPLWHVGVLMSTPLSSPQKSTDERLSAAGFTESGWPYPSTIMLLRRISLTRSVPWVDGLALGGAYSHTLDPAEHWYRSPDEWHAGASVESEVGVECGFAYGSYAIRSGIVILEASVGLGIASIRSGWNRVGESSGSVYPRAGESSQGTLFSAIVGGAASLRLGSITTLGLALDWQYLPPTSVPAADGVPQVDLVGSSSSIGLLFGIHF